MNYIKGDIFTILPIGKSIVVPHVVNNLGAFGAGFAAGVAKHWPIVREQYLEMRALGYVLGTNQVVGVSENLAVINMIAQRGLIGRSNPHPLNYDALRKCMEMVPSVVKTMAGEIHTIKFGSGLAGGDWDRIEEMIDEIWGDLSVTIYTID
jgi:hypothetical protein